MSISSALSNALSGLTVSSRAADVVASNIANAMTDGYGPREVDIAARITGNSGAGARVTGITRHEDPLLSGARRQADAELASQRTLSEALARIEQAIGTPDQPDSLSARAAGFEAGLIAAANAPQSEAQLAATLAAASALVDRFNSSSDAIQAERLRADGAIADAVERLNSSLEGLAELNTRIRQGQGGGRDVSALMDAQARLIDNIAPLVPMTARRDETGAVHLYSQDGEALLDGRPARFGFTPVTIITPDMSVGGGGLSRLTLNGRDLPMDGTTPRMQGGTLSALFDLRDRTMVAAQGRLDAVARNLAERFDTPGLDPTLAPGAPGLFTDAGLAMSPMAETGLAGRLRINAAVDPAHGGATWRLRDGLGAAVAGPVGQTGLLEAQIATLGAARPAASGGFSGAPRSFATLVSDHLSILGTARQDAETRQSGTASRQVALRASELARGVDTDAEMQRLLQIEQTFRANARVITTTEEMLDELMRIGR